MVDVSVGGKHYDINTFSLTARPALICAIMPSVRAFPYSGGHAKPRMLLQSSEGGKV